MNVTLRWYLSQTRHFSPKTLSSFLYLFLFRSRRYHTSFFVHYRKAVVQFEFVETTSIDKFFYFVIKTKAMTSTFVYQSYPCPSKGEGGGVQTPIDNNKRSMNWCFLGNEDDFSLEHVLVGTELSLQSF